MLTPEQLAKAKKLRKAGFSLSSLGHMFGLTKKELKKELTQ